MERLTKRIDGEAVLQECNGPCKSCNGVLCEDVFQVFDRLAAYEDTGLTPEEIIDLQQAWDMYGGEEGITAMLAPPNPPLTLEELQKMDGEPVYCQFGDGVQGWTIVEKDVSGIVLCGPDFDDHTYPVDAFINMEYNDPIGHFGLHVLGWRAYRYKPKED